MIAKEKEDLIHQIADLQTQLTFQEDTIQTLNDIVAKQQQDILELQAQINTLMGEFRTIVSQLGSNGSIMEPPPPHY